MGLGAAGLAIGAGTLGLGIANSASGPSTNQASGSTGSYTSAPTTGSNLPGAYLYQPTGQGNVDTQLQNMFSNWQNPYSTALQTANANNFNNSYNNPYANTYNTAASNAGLMANGASQSNVDIGTNYSMYGGGQAAQGQNAQNAAQGNPYMTGAIQGAGQASSIGQAQALNDEYNLTGIMPQANYGQQINNTNLQNIMQSAYGTQNQLLGAGALASSNGLSTGGQIQGLASPLTGAGQQVYNTAFDPQGQLYNQQYMQNQDQTNAALAQAGLAGSGVGAGILAGSDQNFNTGWQNQKLARQMQGLQGLESAQSTAGSLLGQGYNAQLAGLSNFENAAQNNYNNQLSGAQEAGNLNAQSLSGLMSGAAASQNIGNQAALNYANASQLPSAAYTQQLNNQLGSMSAGNQLAAQGLALSQGGAGLQNTGINQQLLAGQLPYNAQQTITGNRNSALQNYLANASTGQNLSQQQIGNLMQYLGLGQSAGQGLQNANSQNFNNQQLANQNLASGLGNLFSMGSSVGGSGGGGSFGNLFGAGGLFGSPFNANTVTGTSSTGGAGGLPVDPYSIGLAD